MENEQETQTNSTENQCPSFFHNSSTGTGFPEAAASAENQRIAVDPVVTQSTENGTNKRRGGRGGFTCCVSNCFNNSKKHTHLAFYTFPNGDSKEKKDLRKRWIHLIHRKNFNPTNGLRVCSEHFEGGRKTYMNNVPTITPKTENIVKPKPRPTVRARNRDVLSVTNVNIDTSTTSTEIMEVENEHFLNDDETGQEDFVLQSNKSYEIPVNDNDVLQAQIRILQEENEKLKAEKAKNDTEIRCLLGRIGKLEFSFDRYKDGSKLFKFYTGLPDYATFKIVFDSFGPAVGSLIYHNSNTNIEKLQLLEHIKRGRKRTLSPEQEFFLVLVRLQLGLLEEDLAQRASISQQHLSRIWMIWLDFLHSQMRSFPICPSRDTIDRTMPTCFKDTYPATRVIIDCTVFFIEMASSVRSQSATYSQYKHHIHSIKQMICQQVSHRTSLLFSRAKTTYLLRKQLKEEKLHLFAHMLNEQFHELKHLGF